MGDVELLPYGGGAVIGGGSQGEPSDDVVMVPESAKGKGHRADPPGQQPFPFIFPHDRTATPFWFPVEDRGTVLLPSDWPSGQKNRPAVCLRKQII